MDRYIKLKHDKQRILTLNSNIESLKIFTFIKGEIIEINIIVQIRIIEKCIIKK